MTGVDTDLATLDEYVECPNQDAPMHTRTGCTYCAKIGPAQDALRNVKAELSRLRRALELAQDRGDRAADEITRLTQERDAARKEAKHVWCEKAFDQQKARAEAAERALAERMTKESGKALIEDANRWQKAYCEARDQLADTREALEEIEHLCGTRRTGIRMDGSETWGVPLAGDIANIARAALAGLSATPETQPAAQEEA